MKRILDTLAASGPTVPATGEAIISLVAQVRPRKHSDAEGAASQIHNLIALLRTHPEGRRALRDGLANLCGEGRLLPLLTESGIQSSAGFFSEAMEKLVHRVLPPLCDPSDAKDLVGLAFSRSTDFRWVEAVPDALWLELVATVLDEPPAGADLVRHRALEAIQVLSLRIASVGLEPDIVRRLPELEHEGSAVLEQQERTRELLETLRSGKDPTQALAALHTSLDRCDRVVENLRARRAELGASLLLTGLLRRLSQLTARLRLVAVLVAEPRPEARRGSLVKLLKDVVRAENHRHSLKEHIAGNVDLLAYQVTVHTGRTGEHYITHSRAEWKGMFRSAVGGGFIVGFLCWFKLLLYGLKLSPFGQAFVYGMNYAGGFVAIHLTHSTLATKQPAMIASKLAAALDRRTGTPLEDLAGLIVKVARSQFIAFVGNVTMAFPIALIIGLLYRLVTGDTIATAEKAEAMLLELHPADSPAIFHAGIAGVWLFLSGLMSGWIDNAVVTSRVGARLRAHPRLRRVLGEKRLEGLARYLDGNLGPIGGNVFLGLLLGGTGTLGFILGLPIDIRHITFVSGNFGLAVSTLGLEVGWQGALWSLLGIVCVGASNFTVSFGLSLLVAIRSRGVAFTETPRLLGLLWRRLATKPSEFFVPPKEALPAPATPPSTAG